MEVSNASLYDGASALAEACLMAVRAQSHVEFAAHPAAAHREPDTTLEVARAIARNQGLEFEAAGFRSPRRRARPLEALEARRGADVAALVLQQPNFFGNLEEVDRSPIGRTRTTCW